ncbi:MAG TPA: HlyD family efflux transporter periplasmic adaptor subunit, partial [Myxococcaceae bacterium]|nr:HlyD family efflux transporter periplasmic adaptor subunit [Myxococcaceae bacterium]
MTTRDAAVERRTTRARLDPRLVLAIGGGAALLLSYLAYRVYVARQPYEWSGTVETRTISVGSRAGGRVKEVLVREGDRVVAGQPLVLFEPGDLLAQKLAAEGQLLQAKANLEKLERGARPEEIQEAKARAAGATAALQESRAGARREQIAAAEARLMAAQVALDKAQLDADRVHKLFDRGAASRAEADNADAQLRSAIANRDALKQALDELRHGVRIEQLQQAEARAREARANARMVESGSRIEDIAAARGQVDAGQGKLEQILVMIDELTVRAPRAARVETLELRPGDILAPNATTAKLLEDDQLYVRIYVPETLIGHLRVGQEVPISVDSFPGKT